MRQQPSNGQSLQVLGIDPDSYPKVASFQFSEGQPDEIFAALGNGRNAIVTSMALSTLKLTVGERFRDANRRRPADLSHRRRRATTCCRLKSPAVFISQANLAADFHKSEDVLLMVNLKPDADKTAALADVQNIVKDYPQFTPHLTGEYRDDLMATTNSAFGLFYVLALLILIPAALGLLNTLTINILERTREIGVVRAVGGSRSQVRRIVTAEALLLGIFGAAMGVLAGVAMSYGFIDGLRDDWLADALHLPAWRRHRRADHWRAAGVVRQHSAGAQCRQARHYPRAAIRIICHRGTAVVETHDRRSQNKDRALRV